MGQLGGEYQLAAGFCISPPSGSSAWLHAPASRKNLVNHSSLSDAAVIPVWCCSKWYEKV